MASIEIISVKVDKYRVNGHVFASLEDARAKLLYKALTKLARSISTDEYFSTLLLDGMLRSSPETINEVLHEIIDVNSIGANNGSN